MPSEALSFAVDADRRVSALLDAPEAESAHAGLVLAHGAGAGMAHPFMAAVASGLAREGVAVFRYNFPYMEARSGRPDRPPIATATVRAAVAEAARRMPGLPLFAGGKSFGGRMTSTAEADGPLGIRGIVFYGFPLHPAGKPSNDRAAHLDRVGVPMLFLQGTRDDLADLTLIEEVGRRLGSLATLHIVEDGDHSFHVRKASGRDDAAVLAELTATVAAWMGKGL